MTQVAGFFRTVEVASWALGVGLMGFFLSQLALGEVERVSDLAAFEAAFTAQDPDQALWSPGRKTAWQEQKSAAPANVLAVLAIPDLGLKVPVYPDASDLNMDRGAGFVVGTAGPDEVGNIGISGHRDGFFRVLKDLEIGSELTLQTPKGMQRYRITQTQIVYPYDVEVLDPTEDQRVTLITCYPFYFVGSAPQRFVVTAELDNSYVNK
jgi:sortase A